MEERYELQRRIDALFENAPISRAVYDLKEELMVNCYERYQDLVASGMAPEDAMNSAVGSIGNVDELVAALPPDEVDRVNEEWNIQRRERSALTVTVSVGLYILAGVVFFVGVFLSSIFWNPAILLGLALALLICIVPTCLLVYNAYRYPKYQKQNDTVVENFKQYNSSKKRNKKMRGALSSMIWTGTVVLYFIISFTTGAWWITWIIYIIAAFVESLVTMLFKLKEQD